MLYGLFAEVLHRALARLFNAEVAKAAALMESHFDVFPEDA